MDVMVGPSAGLDVHRDDVVAATRVPGTGRRRFGQQTRHSERRFAGLAELALWLAELGVTLVGNEAIGVYWKTVFQALGERFGRPYQGSSRSGGAAGIALVHRSRRD